MMATPKSKPMSIVGVLAFVSLFSSGECICIGADIIAFETNCTNYGGHFENNSVVTCQNFAPKQCEGINQTECTFGVWCSPQTTTHTPNTATTTSVTPGVTTTGSTLPFFPNHTNVVSAGAIAAIIIIGLLASFAVVIAIAFYLRKKNQDQWDARFAGGDMSTRLMTDADGDDENLVIFSKGELNNTETHEEIEGLLEA
eukprot:m.33691 g.33691  ORF g.33691 m.33691 type:complete len:199 (-) comp16856_c0_seq1:428-1024(-)